MSGGGGGGGGRRRSSQQQQQQRHSPSPAAAPVSDLLQQLRALGLGQGGRAPKTYAGLAAAGGGAASGAVGPLGGGAHGGGSYSGGASAFFQRRQGGDVLGAAQGTPLAGSATPPSRPTARVVTPGTGGASPFLEDGLLFHMSGLKVPRPGASATPGSAAPASQQRRGGDMHRTRSAPADEPAPAEAGDASPPLARAFTFAGKPSPRARREAPLPSARTAAAAAAADLLEAAAAAQGGGGDRSPAAAPRAVDVAGVSVEEEEAEDDELATAAAADEGGAPGWSEELLNWMLREKAGLLVEAQRAGRRQRELEAEVERLRARAAAAERESQRLAAERRSLLERVQRVSGEHAEAAARVERLSMENDALSGELQASQEVCREMLAARRAARDALADMQAQNARLLAAYCERKGEAARLKEALRAAHSQHEARVGVLKAQLRAAQGGSRAEAAVGQLRSPPPSPAATASDASPATAQPAQPGASPAASASSVGEDLRAEASGQSADSDPAAEHSGRGQPADKENVRGNGDGGSRARQAGKAPWDDERFELLSLLERLQGQLSVHAEQQASGATPRKQPQQRPRQQRQAAADGSRAPATSPFASQPAGGAEQQRQRSSSPAGGERVPASGAGARPGSRAAANLEPSFESTISGSGSGGAASPAGSCRSVESDGGSPAVAAHHFSADSPLPPSPLPSDSPFPAFTDGSPLPPHSCARSGAPSPPSVRPLRRPVAAEQQPVGASPQSSAGAGGSPSKQQKPHVQRGASATMEAFLSPPAQCPTPASGGAQHSRDEQQRLQQAERRAAELEAELERLHVAAAAAEERAQREERRRSAEAAKAAGNAAFQAQRFEEAARLYSAGLEAGAAEEDASLAAVLHCNRAAAHHACGRFLDALADCFRAAALDPGYPRVLHRRADAYWALGAYDLAAKDLARLLQLGGGQDVAARLADAQRRGRAAHPPNHYAVLGVKPAATPAEVRGAYRALALQYHPDKAAQGGGAGGGLAPEAAQALFRLASEAAQVLGDPEARRAYDLACLRLKYRRFYHAAAA